MDAQCCTQCGAELAPQAHFCSACGAEIQGSATTELGAQPKRLLRSDTILLGTGILVLLIAAVLTVIVQRANNRQAALPDVHDEAGIPYPEVPRMPVEAAKARYDVGNTIFVDVRSTEAYAEAHIPNAVSLPLPELETQYQELPRQAEIITYCT